MAFFGKKSAAAEPFVPQPEKANAWFERARQMAESHNYESSFAFFANGFKLDPRDVAVHKEVLQIASTYYSRGGEKATNKDIKQIDGPTDIEKFATALYVWWHDVTNAKKAVKAISVAVDADQLAFGVAMADTILVLVQRGDKALTHKELKNLMELFKSTGAWNQVFKVGQAALAVNREDSALERELNELAAERALTEGGYNEIGTEEGGFRKFVRDLDKQREIEEEGALAGAGGSEERVLARAKKEYEENPTSPDAISMIVKLLKRTGTTESMKNAFNILMQGYKVTQQYRFRMEAGDIKINMGLIQIDQMTKQLENEPDEDIQQRLDKAIIDMQDFRKKEYKDRSAKYPTDRSIRFKLGELAVEDSDLNLAMECFQKAKDEPRLRVRAGQELGRCFAEEGWYAESIGEFKESLKALAGGDSIMELSIRYDLMQSLASKAKGDDNVDLAREAMEICSGIARKDISYRDIRDCRRKLDTLVKDLG